MSRRIRVINIATLLALIIMTPSTLLMAIQDDWGWQRSAAYNALVQSAFLVSLFSHKLGYPVKVFTFLGAILALIAVGVSFGRQDGLHYLLLGTPTVMLFLLGRTRWPLCALISALAGIAFLVTEFYVPWKIGWSQSFWGAVENPFADGFARLIVLEGIFFVFLILGLIASLFAMTLSILTDLEMSEAALERENARSELLLNNMLPEDIARRLKSAPNETIADTHADVTIMFADLDGFTAYSDAHDAENVVTVLNLLFSRFDELVDRHGLEKIKTIGDAYMVAGGLSGESENHAQLMAKLALDMINAVETLSAELSVQLSVRIGIHRGPAVAGVIGVKRPFYDVWGDTVNVASRMEATSPPGTIQITPELLQMLDHSFNCERADSIEVKGKGHMEPFWLIRRTVGEAKKRPTRARTR